MRKVFGILVGAWLLLAVPTLGSLLFTVKSEVLFNLRITAIMVVVFSAASFLFLAYLQKKRELQAEGGDKKEYKKWDWKWLTTLKQPLWWLAIAAAAGVFVYYLLPTFWNQRWSQRGVELKPLLIAGAFLLFALRGAYKEEESRKLKKRSIALIVFSALVAVILPNGWGTVRSTTATVVEKVKTARAEDSARAAEPVTPPPSSIPAGYNPTGRFLLRPQDRRAVYEKPSGELRFVRWSTGHNRPVEVQTEAHQGNRMILVWQGNPQFNKEEREKLRSADKFISYHTSGSPTRAATGSWYWVSE